MAQWLYRIVPRRPEMVVDPTPEEQRIVEQQAGVDQQRVEPGREGEEGGDFAVRGEL